MTRVKTRRASKACQTKEEHLLRLSRLSAEQLVFLALNLLKVIEGA